MSSLSFKFNKVIKSNVIIRKDDDIIETNDYIATFDGRKNIKPTTKKEYIIPLSNEKSSSLDARAISSIIEETQKLQRGETQPASSNLVIGVNIEIKPEPFIIPEASNVIPNYDEIPIEEYGLAMLRGMGWKKGDPIGLKTKKIVEPINPVLRPKGLGLGAERVVNADAQHLKMREKIEDGLTITSKEEEKIKGYVIGAPLEILKGSPYNGFCGKIEGIDEDNGRVIVHLASENLNITIPKFLTNPLSLKQYNKYLMTHKNGVNTDEIVDKELAFIKAPQKQYGLINMKSARQSDASFHKSPSPHRIKPNAQWVKLHLIVRIIDKHYQNGEYYKQKIIITKIKNKSDIIYYDGTLLESDDDATKPSGHIVKNLTSRMLETVIPKRANVTAPSSLVMVVKGKHQNLIGQMIKKDKGKHIAQVQFTNSSGTRAKDFKFDEICQYFPL